MSMSKKVKLQVINGNEVKSGTTCFNEHNKYKVNCNKKECKNWIECGDILNCSIIAVQNKGSYTLSEISKILGINRIKVCHIEKDIINKIKKQLNSN